MDRKAAKCESWATIRGRTRCIDHEAGSGGMAVGNIMAAVSDGTVCAVLQAAPPIALHGSDLPRTDGNCPVMVDHNGITAYFSHYQPIGHTYRRRGSSEFDFYQAAVATRFDRDPNPMIGKWIEAVWPDPKGGLLGLYHAEHLAPCARQLFIPEIGMARSDDDGLTWSILRSVLQAPENQTDCEYRNGFFAGGYGDLCALPDRERRFLYMPFTSFVAHEPAQGVVMARFPYAEPASALEIWTEGGWRISEGQLPKPIWPTTRGWKHLDPDGFWGPAVHYNQRLDAFVMLLNHTAGGYGNLLQEGIYFSVNRDLSDPESWSRPARLVAGGAWYPQAVGVEPGCSDAVVRDTARFFMAGYSAWTIQFMPADMAPGGNRPLALTKADFTELFGAAHKAPW